MFRLDNILEHWASIYRPLSHTLAPSAKPKDKAFFRIQEIDLQSEWSRNMNLIDHPCLLFRTQIESELEKDNPKRIQRFWGIYFAVKQKGAPNNVVDDDAATDAKLLLDKMTIDLLAFLFDLQEKAAAGRTDVSTPLYTLSDRETRESLRGLRLEQTSWWTTPVHLAGWWLMGIELHALDPRKLCVNPDDYLPPATP